MLLTDTALRPHGYRSLPFLTRCEEIAMADVKVTIRPNGPYLIAGAVELVDGAGNPVEGAGDKPMIALCRCGHSQKKPFCDGSHTAEGFEAE